jgi:mediator of RNA polymerase II transcription subunit 21
MADRLTQLQDAVHEMATQFFSALRYVATHHDAVPVGNEAKLPMDEGRQVDEPAAFQGSYLFSLPLSILTLTIINSRDERARPRSYDQEQTDRVPLTTLPGIGVGEGEQQLRLHKLEAQLKEAEEERRRSVEEKERARERLEEAVVLLRRV